MSAVAEAGALPPVSRPERLAFLLPSMAGGGAERVAVTILTDFLARGYEVDLVLVRAEGDLMSALPAGVTVFDLKASRLVAALIPLARYLRRRRPHALQVRMWPLTVVGILAGRLARVPTRVVVSDHVALTQQYGRLPSVLRLLKATVRLIYPLAAARIVVSAGAADDLAALSGIPRERFTVIYNPVAPRAAAAIPSDVEALWQGCDARIITVGALKAQKNQALLIRAFAHLRRRRGARLMILGQGELLAELRALAAREGVADDVVFPGFAPDPSPYIESSNLFVLSSDYEGFGNVLVEAMRLGVSIVSTDCPSGPSEILGGGRYGELVPRGDAEALAEAMDRALRHPVEPDRLRERSDELSGRHSIDRYLELMLGRALPDDGRASP